MNFKTLVLIAVSTFGLAGRAEEVKTGPHSGKCGASMMLNMIVVQKLNNKAYLVSQNLGYGYPQIGIIGTEKRLQPRQRVNLMLEYAGSGPVETVDGFEKTADVWKECKK